jgi:Insertion element 4 transposase N-terminal/Transposase DDE domain
MELGEAILAVGAGERTASFEEFSAAIDPQWIADALAATGTASLRRRKLPAEYVVWLVIGMALFRDRGIAQVAQHLDLVLPTPTGARGRITPGAMVQARTRLGPQPLAALFTQTAGVWAGAAAEATRWRGLAVYGVDGTTLRVPDTPANDATFGRPGTSRGGPAGYPQLRLVVLLVLRQHLVAAAALGPCTHSEPAVAATLWPQLPDQALVILDRGFTAYALFHTLADAERGRHWLVRVRTGRGALRWTVRQRLGRGDELVDWTPTHPHQRTVGRKLPATLRARAVRVQRRGFRPYLLLTSLLDPVAYPAAELAALYHERWELELAFDEVKTHTLERTETLRSHAPARVEQEVWGLLLGYNLVRLLMARAAPHAGVPPLRLSYWNAVLLLRGFWHSAWYLPPGTLPRHLDTLLQQLALLVIPPRRARRYPRAVKLTHTHYPRKRPAVSRSRRVN